MGEPRTGTRRGDQSGGAADGATGEAAAQSKTRLSTEQVLRTALEESLRLQHHYAQLLNMHDGGQRDVAVFASVETWLARLRETGTIPRTP